MNKIIKLSIHILVFIIFSNCSHYVVNSSGYIRPPKNKKFSYKKRFKKLKNLSVIDTTAIYYLSDSYFYKNSKKYKNGNSYIRFYGDGHFKLQGVKKTPTIEEVNNPNKGIVGYYYIKGKVVKMQLYSDINAGSFQLKFGYIDKNTNLILMHDNPRYDFAIGYDEEKIKRLIKKSPFSPKIYKKTPIQKMVYIKPNW